MDRFKLRLPEILELNRCAVNRIYFFPRDEKGSLVFRKKSREKTLSAKQIFFAFYDQYRLPKWMLEKMWTDHKAAKAKAAEDKKRTKKELDLAKAAEAKAKAAERKRKKKVNHG